MQNGHQPKVVIVGPRGLTVEEANDLRTAFEECGAHASAFRTDEFFLLADLLPNLARATHLLLLLDRTDDAHASSVLLQADICGLRKVAFLCLHTSESLHFYAKRLNEGCVDLVIVRSHAEHSRLRMSWPVRHSLVADSKSLCRSAVDIAQAFVGTEVRQAQMMSAK